ncbi:MAG TPA: YpdA family putative bacillithiol disulfide reductase [Flavisolibacter sp.]|nr:YpdA family putative bacillithiol disulfide reductase [Flavisolibacter sp.]
MKHHTLLIVGGGPIGLACALEAKREGIDYLIIEKGTLVNSLYHYPVNMQFFSTSERLEIGGVPFVTNNPKPKRADALEYYRRVAQDSRLPINLFEEVVSVKQNNVGDNGEPTVFHVCTNKAAYTANNIVVATGFYDIPYLLNIPGEDLPKVKHYYDDPHYYAFQKVVVVGAQNSAVDAALETWRKGAEVTMVVRGPEIGQRVKYWVKPDIENRVKEGSINAYFSSSLKKIKEREVVIETPSGEVRLPNDWVLALTGYQPNLSFLKNMGIVLGDDSVRKPHYDEETHETNVAGIYLAGVICGGMNTHRLFIENAREHAEKIVAHIQKNAKQRHCSP